MPRGTRHRLTGTLGWDARCRLYVLHVPGGGVWRLDMADPGRRLIGHDVTVEGVRVGFDMLDVDRLIVTGGACSSRGG